jgi:hypothetical protein
MGGGGSGMGLMVDTKLVDLDAAWREREIEAAALAANFPTTSLALRVYALEIRIKVIICKRLAIDYLPKHCKTHELDELIIFTGLSSELDDPANAGIRQSWDVLVDFAKTRLNRIRYLPASALAPADLNRQLIALDDPRDGVWTWLSKHP